LTLITNSFLNVLNESYNFYTMLQTLKGGTEMAKRRKKAKKATKKKAKKATKKKAKKATKKKAKRKTKKKKR
jgi:hypothetical protein